MNFIYTVQLNLRSSNFLIFSGNVPFPMIENVIEVNAIYYDDRSLTCLGSIHVLVINSAILINNDVWIFCLTELMQSYPIS